MSTSGLFTTVQRRVTPIKCPLARQCARGTNEQRCCAEHVRFLSKCPCGYVVYKPCFDHNRLELSVREQKTNDFRTLGHFQVMGLRVIAASACLSTGTLSCTAASSTIPYPSFVQWCSGVFLLYISRREQLIYSLTEPAKSGGTSTNGPGAVVPIKSLLL